MNVETFLNHKKVCPLCGELLSTTFHSKRRQKIRYENDRLIVIFDMPSLNKSDVFYKACFSIGMKNNDFYIDFYDKNDNILLNYNSTSALSRFLSFSYNLKDYKIYRSCCSCYNYLYSSNRFSLDFKNSTIGDLSCSTEHFGLSSNNQDGYKIYRLANFYEENKSVLFYDKMCNDVFDDVKNQLLLIDLSGCVSTKLIDFVSKDETINRISKLLIFS